MPQTNQNHLDHIHSLQCLPRKASLRLLFRKKVEIPIRYGSNDAVVLLMEIIAQQLSKFQALNVVFFTLASWNIYISEGKEVFFADWSLARTSKELQDKHILKLFDSVPEYALGTG